MSAYSERYSKIAGQFERRVNDVPDAAWDNPSPCEGWAARDVVGHLVEWLPDYFFAKWGIEHSPGPPVSKDPAAAWHALSATIQAALDDPAIATAERDTPMGRSSFEQSLDLIGTNDIFLHTWDLARATGLDETLDPDEVHALYEGMQQYDEILRQSGQYGPKVEVPDDADEQTKLIAFIGRRP